MKDEIKIVKIKRPGRKTKRLHRKRKISIFIICGVILLICIFYGWRLLTLRDFAAQSKTQIISQLAEARLALSSLNPDGATLPLSQVNAELKTLNIEAEKYGVLKLAGWWGNVQDKFKALPTILQNLTGISGVAIHVNEDISYLKEHTVGLMMSGRGDELLIKLGSLQDKLARLNFYLANAAFQQAVDAKTQTSLSKFSQEIGQATKALSSLREFLNPVTPRHALVMFQNESELRPAGGFLGSYADITIAHGAVAGIDVRDIYDPDGQLDIQMTPPRPLQRLTKDWEIRDANWFFDFPASAKQVLSFINQSKMYTEHNIHFDGAMSVNTKVLASIIGLVGPIELPEYKLTITPETFMRELQREVEQGYNKKINQPKKILQALAPILLERLKTRTPEQNQKLLESVNYHLSRRDIQLYLDDPVLEAQFKERNVAGELLPLSKASTSSIIDYLGVATANMAGGKSDYFTQQDIALESFFSASGTLVSNLKITRKHSGQNETDWWYTAPNKTYTQIYLPLGSRIYNATGTRPWPDPITRDYSSYHTEPTVVEIESSHRFFEDEQLDRFIAFGKTVFAGWITTRAGATSTFKMSYRNPKKFSAAVKNYEFIFEKQSGANTSFSFSITAPPGYKWQETGSANLKYESADPPGRVHIRQTLIPIR